MLTEERVTQLAKIAFGNFRQTLIDGPTITWDFKLGNIATVTLGGNRTLQIINASNEDFGIIDVYQDTTGSRTLNLPGNLPTSGITLSAGAGQKDKLGFHKNFGTFDWDKVNYGTVPDATIAAPVLLSINTTTDGIYIDLAFSKAMSSPINKQSEFAWTKNGVAKSFSAAALKTGDNTVIRLTCYENVANGDVVTVTYMPGDVIAVDGGIATAFSGATATNNVPIATNDIPNYASWNMIVDPRSTANLVLSGNTITTIKDSSGNARTTTGGSNSALYNSSEKFIDFNVVAAASTYYTFGSTITLPTAWAIVLVIRFTQITNSFTLTNSSAGGIFLGFSTSSSNGNHLGLSINSTVIIPTSSTLANHRFIDTTTKYRIIITKTGTTIKYWVQGVAYTSPATSIARDYFTRFLMQTSAIGPNLFLHMLGNYVADSDIVTLDNFLQTI